PIVRLTAPLIASWTIAMDTDRNLLFGVLALQADAITASQFVEACASWAARKDAALADVLLQRGWITPEDKSHVDYLLARKLQNPGGDPRASLAEAAGADLRRSLAAVADPDVQQSLAGLGSHQGQGPLATTAYQPETRQRFTLAQLHGQGGIG